MDDSTFFPQPVKELLEQISDSRLRYHVLAAYLIVNCHDPDEIQVQEDYSGGDVMEKLDRQYLPFDEETREFFHVDPLELLYRKGREAFAQKNIDPAEVLRITPPNEEEKRCLEILLGDNRIPYSRHETVFSMLTSGSCKPLEDSDLSD